MKKATTTYALGLDFGTLSVRAVLVSLLDIVVQLSRQKTKLFIMN
ncbi:hypothetical protein [Blautia faecicola]|nr:hypothetical protein [Blautia faecicola]